MIASLRCADFSQQVFKFYKSNCMLRFAFLINENRFEPSEGANNGLNSEIGLAAEMTKKRFEDQNSHRVSYGVRKLKRF